MTRSCGLLAMALGAVACRKPAPVDPAEEAFHQAVLRFAEVSKLTQDLTYRDPRFDPILDALDHIPANTEPKPHAMALAERIRAARVLADAQDRGSERLRAQADAPPAFDPQPRLQAPPPRASGNLAKPEATPAPAVAGGDMPSSGAPVAKSAGRHLPSWYASYFGTGEQAGDGPPDGGASQGQAEAAPASDVPPPTAQKRSSERVDAGAPPAVFGVPGPAGHALQGRPGNQ